jgi:YfiH family protein
MLQAKRVSRITLLHSPMLDAIPGVFHAFSTRRAEHNDLTLGPTASDNPMIAINRSRFLAAAGVPGWPVLKLNQVHSATIHDMKDTWASNEPRKGDAAITAVRGALLGVQTADCVPILLADRRGQVVGAVHAGWRGTAAGITQRTVQMIHEKYGISPTDLIAVIGPHNAICCYEVGDDVIDAVKDADCFVFRPEWQKPHFNQALANQKQLLGAGIPQQQIAVSTICTQCRGDLFYSYRREGSRTGRMLSIIGLAP